MLVKKQLPQTSHQAKLVPLGRRGFALVDPEDFERVSAYHWRLLRSQNCFYAARRFIRNGKTITIKLHRFIMNTLPGYECHHKNHNPIDDRRENLENLTPSQHREKHVKL